MPESISVNIKASRYLYGLAQKLAGQYQTQTVNIVNEALRRFLIEEGVLERGIPARPANVVSLPKPAKPTGYRDI